MDLNNFQAILVSRLDVNAPAVTGLCPKTIELINLIYTGATPDSKKSYTHESYITIFSPYYFQCLHWPDFIPIQKPGAIMANVMVHPLFK